MSNDGKAGDISPSSSFFAFREFALGLSNNGLLWGAAAGVDSSSSHSVIFFSLASAKRLGVCLNGTSPALTFCLLNFTFFELRTILEEELKD